MFQQKLLQLFLILSLLLIIGNSTIIYYNGIENDSSLETSWKNGALLNSTIESLVSGDELIFGNTTYYLMGGIVGYNLENIIFHFEGTLIFSDNVKEWPMLPNGNRLECFQFYNINNVTFTSSNIGLLNGQGETWWGLLGYVEYLENRPRMLSIGYSSNILIENIFFKSSPYWTVWIYDVDGLEIRNSEISNRRDDFDGHNDWNLVAFNTDGFDVTGKNVWIHDCTIWNQDDCIAVKDGSENMLFERIHASGLGLTIGSIGGSTVRNITFRDSYMHRTYKGIYTKFRGSGLITDVLYENIYMFEPEQYPIWIGPAQQSDSVDICAAHPCSLCWPSLPFSQCNMPLNASYINITLRNITIINPTDKTGVIIGSSSNPIQNLVFDGVIIQNPPANYLECNNVENGIAMGGTYPVPSCFTSSDSSQQQKEYIDSYFT